MDVPAGQSSSLVWRGKADLTARYVKFWNRLLRKMRRINPDVTLMSYAYSAYAAPPPTGLEVHDGIVLQVVPGLGARGLWRGWARGGATLFLRPNWWHVAGVAPHVPLHEMGRYFKFAESHGMRGFFFDGIMGWWAVQGVNYYLIARLSVRPDLSVDQVIDEYCSAFGDAAPAIRDYLEFWEQFSNRAGYYTGSGGTGLRRKESRYERLLKRAGLAKGGGAKDVPMLQGSWNVFPHMYTDEVLESAHSILDRSEELIGDDNGRARARVEFLRKGLKHTELTREVLRMGYTHSRAGGATYAGYKEKARRLMEMRERLSEGHAVWGEATYAEEKRRNVPTVEARLRGAEEMVPAR
jgi:hypothetical protein